MFQGRWRFPLGFLRDQAVGVKEQSPLTIALAKPLGGLITLPILGQDPRERRTRVPLAPVLVFWLGTYTQVCKRVWIRPSV